MFKRIGAKKEKFMFSLHVHSLHINLPDNTLTKLVVKRGSKKSSESTPARIFSKEAVYEFVFESAISMYLKSNAYLKKNLQIRLINLEGSKPTKDGLVVVISRQIDLAELVNHGRTIKNQSFPLKKGCDRMSTFTLTIQIEKQVERGDRRAFTVMGANPQ